jgi:hypothetical protein
MNHRGLAVIPFGSVLAAGLALMSGPPPIRHVPRVVDVHFASRMHLCPGTPDRGGIGQANDTGKTITEFLGTGLREIAVHQIGDSFPKFNVVQQHIRQVMSQRPQEFSRYSPWAEATPLAANGILATLRYTRGRSGRLEIAGSHLCFQDTTGTVWWVRVGSVDVWPRSGDTTNQR